VALNSLARLGDIRLNYNSAMGLTSHALLMRLLVRLAGLLGGLARYFRRFLISHFNIYK